jgi:hypothetical protein
MGKFPAGSGGFTKSIQHRMTHWLNSRRLGGVALATGHQKFNEGAEGCLMLRFHGHHSL